jgi:hypothetical protein
VEVIISLLLAIFCFVGAALTLYASFRLRSAGLLGNLMSLIVAAVWLGFGIFLALPTVLASIDWAVGGNRLDNFNRWLEQLVAEQESTTRWFDKFVATVGPADGLIFVVATYLAYTAAKHFLSYSASVAWRLLAGVFALPIYFALTRDYAWYVESALWALGIFLTLVGIGLRNTMIRRKQETADEQAAHILKALRAGTEPKPRFSLYLRSFELTRRLTTQDMDLHSPGSPPTHVDFETLLRDAMKPIAPLLAIGSSDIDSGAMKLQTSNESWQGAFRQLAREATVIFLVPGDTGGTMFEAQWLLKNGLIPKCIFVMPMSPTERLSYAQNWRDVVVALDKLEFPAYNKQGAFLKFNASGELIAQVSLPQTIVTPQSLRAAIKRMMP